MASVNVRSSVVEQLRISEIGLREELAISLRRYVRHAELFGILCVGSTVVTYWHGLLPAPVDLTWITPAEQERILDERERVFAEVHRAARRLQLELDRIEANRKGRSGRFTVGKRRRRSRAETAVAAQLLADDGLTRVEIAAKLGVSAKTIDNLLSPGVVQTTEPLRERVRGMKPPANQGVKTGGLGPHRDGSTMRGDPDA
jgi:hypothetical protein